MGITTDLTDLRNFLIEIGEDPHRPGLIGTPYRFVKSWEFFTSGYSQDPSVILKTFEDGAQGLDEMVLQGGIHFWSNCEHHLLPFFGAAHIAYIPHGKIVGLSKLARLVDVFARRLQVQERLGAQVADALVTYLSPDVGVVLRCRHSCMESRGVQRPGTVTYTSALRGAIKSEPEARAEFLKFVQMADAGSNVI